MAELFEAVADRGVVDVVADLDDQAADQGRVDLERSAPGSRRAVGRACRGARPAAPSSSGTAERTVTGRRFWRRSQSRPGRRGRSGRAGPSRPWRLRTRRKRTTVGRARPSNVSARIRSLSVGGDRAARPAAAANCGCAREHVGDDLVELVEHGLGLAPLLGGVDQGLGVGPRHLGRVVLEDRPGRRPGRRWSVRHAVRLPVPVGRRARRQLAHRRLDQAAVVGLVQLLGQDLAGDRDGQVGGLGPDLHQRLVAGGADLALGALPRRPRPRPAPCG